MSASSRQPTGFLDLPSELRLQIYRYCLVRSDPVVVYHTPIIPYRRSHWGSLDEKTGLLLVSKKIGLEAIEVLYGDNIFQFSLHLWASQHLKDYFTAANRRRIRKMQVLMQPHGIHYCRMPTSRIFFPVLANLNKLSIVAQQPLQDLASYYPPPFEDEMHIWIRWLRSLLQFLTRRLPDRCIVEVDDDDSTETSAVMRECLPNGYRKVKTVAGDLYFERNDHSNDYSIESGHCDDDYWDYYGL